MGSDERPGCRRTRGATELAPGPGVVVRKRNTRVAFKSAAHPVRPCRRHRLRWPLAAARFLPHRLPFRLFLIWPCMCMRRWSPAVSGLGPRPARPPRCRARRRRTGLPLVRCGARTRDEGREGETRCRFPLDVMDASGASCRAPARCRRGETERIFAFFTVSRLEYFRPAYSTYCRGRTAAHTAILHVTLVAEKLTPKSLLPPVVFVRSE